jgi:hypothetical protein
MAQSINNGNYAKKVKAYLLAHEGQGYLIALADVTLRGVEYTRSLPQWGAWLAFFRRNRIKQPYMLKTEVYMVPAEWPHLFTSDSTVQQDHDAGDRFAAQWKLALAKCAAREWGPDKEPPIPRTMAEAESLTKLPR